MLVLSVCCHLHIQVLSVKLTNLNSVFVFCVLPNYICVHIGTFFKLILNCFIAVLYPSPCLKLSLKVNLKNDDFCPVSIHCVSSLSLLELKRHDNLNIHGYFGVGTHYFEVNESLSRVVRTLYYLNKLLQSDIERALTKLST